MAIKKALYGRQPGCFCLDFPSVLLLSQEIRFFVLILEFSIKSQVKPIWTYKLLSQCMKFLFQHESAHRMILRFLLVCRIELIFQYVCNFSSSVSTKIGLIFRRVQLREKRSFCCCCFSGQILPSFVLCTLWAWESNFHDSFKQESEHTT